ncbi:MAG: cupin domain-containing protein [Proteobacteria bacterium]|nr:cupin domain-containing protein [Pseudomonadota bacterium]
MPLLAKADEVRDGANVLQVRGGAMSTKMVYGNDCNLMVAVRAAGYHSNPHRHDAEQLNYVLDGEVWVFVAGEAFLMKKGDFSRIPRNALHWAWNRSEKSCTIVEAHAPACDPLIRANAVGLFREGESPDLSTAVETIRGGESPDELEARVFGASV